MTWQPDFPYESEGLEPQQIRDDFEDMLDQFEPRTMLSRIAGQLSTDTLAEFMDDLAMGRI